MVGMWKSMFCFKLNWDLNWKYESGWDWDYVDDEIMRFSLKWRFDCGWLNWNDNLVVNWILMVYVWLSIVWLLIDFVWLGNELDFLSVWLGLVTQKLRWMKCMHTMWNDPWKEMTKGELEWIMRGSLKKVD